MSTPDKDKHEVIITEGQSQQGGQDSQSTPQKDWKANDPIAQRIAKRIAKRKELRDKIEKIRRKWYERICGKGSRSLLAARG